MFINKKGFTLVEVIISWIIITIIILNIASFFLFAWKLKMQFEDDRAVLGILTSYIEAKKATCIGTGANKEKSMDYGFDFGTKGEFETWKTYCINMWEYSNSEKKENTMYPPLFYPLPSTEFYSSGEGEIRKENNKYIEIKYQWCKIDILRNVNKRPKYYLMPVMYVWCNSPRSNKAIGMYVTNSMPWRNYNNGQFDNL